jgi:hypothetical protein
MQLTFRSAIAFALAIGTATSAHAGATDKWCAKTKEPRSLVLCSDARLRQLADERQRAFDAASRNLDSFGRKLLLTDQNDWVHSYAIGCGLGDRVPDPTPPAMVECFAKAGEARVTYLRAYAAEAETPLTVSVPHWWCGTSGGYFPETRECIPKNAWMTNGTVTIDCRDATEAPDVERCSAAARQRAYVHRQAALAAVEAAAQRARAEAEAAAEHDRVIAQQQAAAAEAARLGAEQRAQLAEANARRQRAEAEAELIKLEAERQRKQEAERRAEAKLKYEEQLAALVKKEKDAGYRPIDFEDYLLDEKLLAATKTKVAVFGYYQRSDGNDVLVKSVNASSNSEDNVIHLLTDDATRDARKYMLTCRESTDTCPMTVVGRVNNRRVTRFFGVEHSEPCLVVDDVWNVPQPVAPEDGAFAPSQTRKIF